MSNEEFGRRIGVSPSMASRIRNGRRLPGTVVLRSIHLELKIPLRELLDAHREGPDAFGRLVTERIDAAVTA